MDFMGVVVGFLAALFGGTPAQVSGPTGPMSVTVAGVVAGLAAVGFQEIFLQDKFYL